MADWAVADWPLRSRCVLWRSKLIQHTIKKIKKATKQDKIENNYKKRIKEKINTKHDKKKTKRIKQNKNNHNKRENKVTTHTKQSIKDEVIIKKTKTELPQKMSTK